MTVTSAADLAVDRDTNPTSSDPVEEYLREVREQMRRAGRRISMSGLRRLYWRWLESAQTDWDFSRYCLTYADPTGEEATHRALAAQVRRRVR
ncbi:hypothetical protein [Micropruina sp.]|uniref:hypothetical protein n=1 Tax=Micropruina sp. TaxID=2737536 RepID=UPI0039E4D287